MERISALSVIWDSAAGGEKVNIPNASVTFPEGRHFQHLAGST